MVEEQKERKRLRKMLRRLHLLDNEELLALIKSARRLYDRRETAEFYADTSFLFV